MSPTTTLKEACIQLASTLTDVVGTCSDDIEAAAILIAQAVKEHRPIIAFGNGGSASQAEHFVAELVGRYKKERLAIPAIALTCNSSTLTAIGNDYGYEDVFTRQIEAFALSKPLIIAFTTSGKSPNVVHALRLAKGGHGLSSIAFTGSNGTHLRNLSDVCIVIPSGETARIQEAHLLISHVLCQALDEDLF